MQSKPLAATLLTLAVSVGITASAHAIADADNLGQWTKPADIGPVDPEPGDGKAMSLPAAARVYGQHSGYRNLNNHLTRHGLRQWQEGEPVFTEARNLRPKTLDQAAAWVNQPSRSEPIEERAANLGAILATQAHWLTERLLDRQARDFEAGGGFSERLYRSRTKKPPGPT